MGAVTFMIRHTITPTYADVTTHEYGINLEKVQKATLM
jgi:hypothetical protein